jgi:hypothetical protein
MGRRESVAALIVNETYQQAWHRRPRAVLVGVVVRSQVHPHSLPQFTRNDRFVFAGIDLPSVFDFT